MSAIIRSQELKWFYTIDRKIFLRLVVELHRNPAQSMRVIALWLWMETMGLPNMVLKLLKVKGSVLNSAAGEAISCIEYMEESQYQLEKLPTTSSILGKTILLKFFDKTRDQALDAIWNTVSEALSIAFEDVIKGAIRGKPRPMVVNLPYYHSKNSVPQEERTMFVTFSSGYPVLEVEVNKYLNRLYGDCIEVIHMQEVPPPVQPMYAMAVFRSASKIELVLDGKPKAKFVINGKNIWMRKFEPR